MYKNVPKHKNIQNVVNKHINFSWDKLFIYGVPMVKMILDVYSEIAFK